MNRAYKQFCLWLYRKKPTWYLVLVRWGHFKPLVTQIYLERHSYGSKTRVTIRFLGGLELVLVHNLPPNLAATTIPTPLENELSEDELTADTLYVLKDIRVERGYTEMHRVRFRHMPPQLSIQVKEQSPVSFSIWTYRGELSKPCRMWHIKEPYKGFFSRVNRQKPILFEPDQFNLYSQKPDIKRKEAIRNTLFPLTGVSLNQFTHIRHSATEVRLTDRKGHHQFIISRTTHRSTHDVSVVNLVTAIVMPGGIKQVTLHCPIDRCFMGYDDVIGVVIIDTSSGITNYHLFVEHESRKKNIWATATPEWTIYGVNLNVQQTLADEINHTSQGENISFHSDIRINKRFFKTLG